MIAMRAKDVEFEVTYIDLRDKPQWFNELSPHGKVPVLVVDDAPLFESNAIAEYLDETVEPRLHPQDPVKRARNRAWTDFVVDFSRALGGVSYATSRGSMEDGFDLARKRCARLEEAINKERGNSGPYFNGDALCLVDAAYAPFLQRFAIAEAYLQSGLLQEFPALQAWSDALLGSEEVRSSVVPDFNEKFIEGLHRRGSYAAQLIDALGKAGT